MNSNYECQNPCTTCGSSCRVVVWRREGDVSVCATCTGETHEYRESAAGRSPCEEILVSVGTSRTGPVFGRARQPEPTFGVLKKEMPRKYTGYRLPGDYRSLS